MAGSYAHITDEQGRFTGTRLIDNLGDAYEALEECYGMIWLLAGGDAARVADAQSRYVEGLHLSPGSAAGEPRYGVTDDGQFTYCLDCGSLVIDRVTHTRFHSILSSHAWTLAVLQNTHLAAHLHDKYDAVERIKRRTFDNWSADALAEVMAEREAPDGT